jgi:hypothetical protein
MKKLTGADVISIGGPLVGLDVGEPLRDMSFSDHPSEAYTFNPTPMIVCFDPSSPLTGNVITVMGEVISTVDALLQRFRAAAA